MAIEDYYFDRVAHDGTEKKQMSETLTLKKLVGEVVYRKDESESKARIGFKPEGQEETEWYTLWRKNYQTKLPNPADSKCVKGAYGKLVLRFKRGGPKDKNNPEAGFYEDEWQIHDIDPVDDRPATAEDAREVFAQTDQPKDTRPARLGVPSGLTDRDKSIVSQVAWKCAAQLGAVHYNAVGEKEFDINVVGKWAREIAADIQSMTKDPFLWSE